MNIEDIKKSFEGICISADIWHPDDMVIVNELISKLEQAEKVITVAIKHIDGKDEKFSEREKIPVLFQLNEVLKDIRGN